MNFFSQQQKSGIFFIEDKLPSTHQKNIYFIFFSRGNIVFAGDTYSFSFERIKEYLNYYDLTEKFNHLQKNLNESNSIAEYEAILLLGNKQLINAIEQKNLCEKIIEEILFKIISLNTGRFIWQNTFNLQPLIVSLKIENILSSIFQKQIAWRKLSPYIKNLEQCPNISQPETKDFLLENLHQQLVDQIDGNSSFIQLSRLLHTSLITIGETLYPYIKKGIIQVINAEKPEPAIDFVIPINPQVICFSTSNEWTLNINKASVFNQYNFLIPDDVNQFFTYIFNWPIKVIILQSEVDNNYNTYNFCKIIRHNSRTSHLPIIMVVNEYIFKDNLISKMYGVTEYISENIFEKKILQILDKYL